MTAAVYRSSALSASIPQTQNTAPVLEFNCLYTRDIRRKHKRWQDGFLRFHTFNKRLMVYDVSRNFVGDTHWKERDELQEGDEATLEKDGVMVQVVERVGMTETDLTELRNSRRKGSSNCESSSPLRAAQMAAPRALNGTSSRPVTQLKHRSLNALLGTPRGPIGKAAVPTKSPFEQRHAEVEKEGSAGGRPRKKQRVEPVEAPVRNVAGTTKNTEAAWRNSPPLWARTACSGKQTTKAPEARHHSLNAEQIIDLTEDVDRETAISPGFSSDAFMPPSSPPKQPVCVQETLPRLSSSPAFQTQRARANPNQQGTSNANQTSRAGSTRHSSTSARSQSRRTGGTLRVAATAPKKKTLLCQEQLSKKSSRVHSANTEKGVDTLLEAASPNSQRGEPAKRQAKNGKKRATDGKGVPYSNIAGTEVPYRKQSVSPTFDLRPEASFQANAQELADLDRVVVPSERLRAPQPEAALLPKGRELQRAISESWVQPAQSKIPSGAPARITPARVAQAAIETEVSPAHPARAAPQRSRINQPIKRAISLNLSSNGTSAVIIGRPFQPPKAPTVKTTKPETAANPWSREAFDLFTWRPPGWDEEQWCVQATGSAAETVA